MCLCPSRVTENSKIFVLATKLFSSLHFQCLLIDWDGLSTRDYYAPLHNWSYSIVNFPFVKSNIINFHLWNGISQYHKLIVQLNVLMSCLLPQMSPGYQLSLLCSHQVLQGNWNPRWSQLLSSQGRENRQHYLFHACHYQEELSSVRDADIKFLFSGQSAHTFEPAKHALEWVSSLKCDQDVGTEG